MSNNEIVDGILNRMDYVQYCGNKDNLSCIMHFFLVDASYQTFLKFKWDASGKEKKLLDSWRRGYELFFADFKAAYTKDQYAAILDKVDDFEDYLSHHLNIAEIAVQEADNTIPLDVQLRSSACWLSNLLANDAKDFYGEIWKTRLHEPKKNRYIEQVCRASFEYGKRWNKALYLTEKQIKRIEDSVHIIANKICDWVVKDYEKEIEKKDGNIK